MSLTIIRFAENKLAKHSENFTFNKYKCTILDKIIDKSWTVVDENNSFTNSNIQNNLHDNLNDYQVNAISM